MLRHTLYALAIAGLLVGPETSLADERTNICDIVYQNRMKLCKSFEYEDYCKTAKAEDCFKRCNGLAATDRADCNSKTTKKCDYFTAYGNALLFAGIRTAEQAKSEAQRNVDKCNKDDEEASKPAPTPPPPVVKVVASPKSLVVRCKSVAFIARQSDGKEIECGEANLADYKKWEADHKLVHFGRLKLCPASLTAEFKKTIFPAKDPLIVKDGAPPFECPADVAEGAETKHDPKPEVKPDPCKEKGMNWKTVYFPDGSWKGCENDWEFINLNEWERRAIVIAVRVWDIVIPSAPAAEPGIPRAPIVHAPRPTVPSGKSPVPKSDITGIPEDRAKRKDVGPVTPTPPEHKISPPKGFAATPPRMHTPTTPSPTVHAPGAPTPPPTPPTASPPVTPTPIVRAPEPAVHAPTITGPGDRVGGVKADVKSKGREEDLAKERDDVLKLPRKP